MLGINLRGVFVATQRAGRTMVDKGIEGAIVNMSSINAQLAIPAIPPRLKVVGWGVGAGTGMTVGVGVGARLGTGVGVGIGTGVG